MTNVVENKFQFNFEKTYREIDVAGNLYKVSFDDESMLKYQEGFVAYEKKAKELQAEEVDIREATPEQLRDMNAKQREVVKDAIEIFLGEDTFEELYEKAGRSIMNLFSLVNYLTKLVEAELRAKAGSNLDAYLTQTKK
ncbi:hypothetical protein CON97_05500 [Bacillus pseudomycoides]|uniref:hypothetical protein n=1 Tax=Bacillus pseudomycoides TaxID=64104 RepID=UPI000BEDE2AA|nr:hypothetical protein [Bacillus pseudomycoides]PED73061.1 hypothetical protein CON97_05500 [Bacillus pseudomycoides]PEP61176.1 hypothetical protein CN591_18500 [Bacillus pseudomycoides]PHA49369.1 hypothetical protein COE73_13150 [Bacillus pseudomycoides]